MAAPSTIVALLLTFGVFAAATIGFGGGIGALPFAITSLTAGPNPTSDAGSDLQGKAIQQLAGGSVIPSPSASAAAATPSPSQTQGAGTGSDTGPAVTNTVAGAPAAPLNFQGTGGGVVIENGGGGTTPGPSSGSGLGNPGPAQPPANPTNPGPGDAIVQQVGTGLQQTLGPLLGTGPAS